MEMSARWAIKALAAPASLALLLAGPAASTLSAPISARRSMSSGDEKHFSVSGTPDLTFITFDGSIEIRPWDQT
jgi:hypothetical protein